MLNYLGIVVLVILCNYLSEPIEGISKQEISVKKYLIQEEKYKEDQIIELRRLGPGKNRVFVSIKDKEDKAYI